MQACGMDFRGSRQSGVSDGRRCRLVPSLQRRHPGACACVAHAGATRAGTAGPTGPALQSQTIEYLAIAATMSGMAKFCATVNTPMRPRDSRRRQKFSTTK